MRIWIDALARDACEWAGAGLRALGAGLRALAIFVGCSQFINTSSQSAIERGGRLEKARALLGLGPREVVRPAVPLFTSRVFPHLAL